MVHVVYFNQWFSSMTEVIRDIKEKHHGCLKIIASSKNPMHVYKNVVDEFIVENWKEADDEETNKDNYLAWLQKTFDVYNVDVAFIRKHANWVVDNAEVVTMGRTQLILEWNTVFHKLEKKSAVYEALSASGDAECARLVPTYCKVFNNYDTIIDILRGTEKKCCLKLDCDEGGQSFRSIEPTCSTGVKTLKKPLVNTLYTNDALNLIESLSEDESKQVLFMEYLNGPELSVDCYRSKQGFIAICREKEPNSRVQRIFYNEDVKNLCKKLADKFDLRFPFNVQFRYKGDKGLESMKLIDLNLRLSGGVYHESAVGLNIAEVCILDAIEKDNMYSIDDFVNFKEKKVTHFESAVEIF